MRPLRLSALLLISALPFAAILNNNALGVEIKFVAGLNVRLDATGPRRDQFSKTDTKQY